VEVRFPEDLCVNEFRALVETELVALREKYVDYDRKTLFGDHPYFRFFRKFKKTYPVMMQFESVLLKGRPFPSFNPVAEVPFLMELTTQVLSGAHDADRISGPVTLYCAAEKEEFLGMRGDPFHTYPGDFCGRDDQGIIFSLIAGADARTCVCVDINVIGCFRIVKRYICMANVKTLTELSVDIKNELRIGADASEFVAGNIERDRLLLHVLGDLELEMEPNVAIKSTAPIFSCFVRLEFGKRGRGMSFFIITRTNGKVFHGSFVAISI
jgi:hypothetical protein